MIYADYRSIDEMDEDSFQKMREDAFAHAQEKHKRIIENWCRECGLKEPVGYANDYDGVITIYTNRPGVLIGKGGECVRKFEKVMREEFHKDYKVRFIEVMGGFVNI